MVWQVQYHLLGDAACSTTLLSDVAPLYLRELLRNCYYSGSTIGIRILWEKKKMFLYSKNLEKCIYIR